ncbi:MAG: ThuA domain-containing protein [Planctomycetota bacterium]
MSRISLPGFILLLCLLWTQTGLADDVLVYEGTDGVGKGKHIVFIANDHEYRSEQTCPLIAKLLAKHHGFKCTVLFGLDRDGHIKAGAADLPGMEALEDADLLVFFTRFMKLKDEQADLLVDYFERGGPVVGLRTSTHCFNGQSGKWAKLNFNYEKDDYRGGLGEQVFGNTWHKERGQSHYGSNHKMSCTITPAKGVEHAILTGVGPIHAYSGAYRSQPPADATPLLQVQVLNTFQPSEEANQEKPIVNAGWTREQYVAPSGKTKNARVVYTSLGASEDLLDQDARRLLTNACFWAIGLESKIANDLEVSIVGKYHPTFYTNGVYVGGVKPQDLAGWDSEIMPISSPIVGINDKRFLRRSELIFSGRPDMKKRLMKQQPDLFK